MLPSPTSPPDPPYPLVGLTALILLYMVIFRLIQDSGDATEPFSGMSVEEIQDLPSFDWNVNMTGTCAVCLEDFQAAESCRIFPNCSHVFHADCIDPWLVRRINCPACRSPFQVQLNLDNV